MLHKLSNMSSSAWYWFTLIAAGLTAEGVALFYQYALDIRPCVVCIHSRIWLVLFIGVAAAGLLMRHSGWLLTVVHALVMFIMLGLLERSYILLGTERGWMFGSCDFDLGLPGWLDLQAWFPGLFKVWEACGYTPELLFGITMAEALLVMSTSLAILSFALIVTTIIKKNPL